MVPQAPLVSGGGAERFSRQRAPCPIFISKRVGVRGHVGMAVLISIGALILAAVVAILAAKQRDWLALTLAMVGVLILATVVLIKLIMPAPPPRAHPPSDELPTPPSAQELPIPH